MATFTTPKGANAYEGTGEGGHRGLVHALFAVEVPTTAIDAAAEIIRFGHIPAGAVLVDGYVKSDALDGGTTLTINVGTEATTTLLVSATTIGQTGNTGSHDIIASNRYTKFTASTRLQLTTAASAQTPAGGTFFVGLSYFIDPEINVTTGVTPTVVS